MRKEIIDFERLLLEEQANPKKKTPQVMSRQAARLLAITQLQLLVDRKAEVHEDGSIVSYPGNGWRLQVRLFDKEGRVLLVRALRARGWSGWRRRMAKLFNVGAELKGASHRRKHVPDNEPASLEIEIRDLRRQMRDALIAYELVDASYKMDPKNAEVRRARRAWKLWIAQLVWDQRPDPSFNIYADEDGSPVLQLEDERCRKVKVSVGFKDKPPSKKWRSCANAWLRNRRKDPKNVGARDELQYALLHESPIPRDLFFAMIDIDIQIRCPMEPQSH